MSRQGPLYLATVAIVLLGSGWVFVTGSPETDLAAPGAPLYEIAVTESIITMMSKQEQAELGAQSRPPSPGPGYFWCENCKTYHQGQAAPNQAAAPGQRSPAAAEQRETPPGSSLTRPPSPGEGFYWCESCKTYHRNLDEGTAQGTPAQRAALPIESVIDTRPPSPGEGYTWCENCKTYHLRQPAASQPGTAPATPHVHAQPPADSDGAALPLDSDYYYCESCKTYHRRQPATLNPLFQGTTNRLDQTLIPAAAE